MTINYETIDFPSSECFRVLRWTNDVNRVEMLDCQRGIFIPVPGFGGHWHWHQEVEITFVETGHGLRVVGDETREISGNSGLAILGRGLPHYWNFSGTSSGVCLQFSDTGLVKLLTHQGRSEIAELVEQAAYGIEVHSPDCDRAIELLRQLTTQPSLYMETFGLLFQLLGVLANVDSHRMRRISSIRFDGHQGNAAYGEMQEAVEWIMEHYDSEIRLPDVLEMVQMSRASFSRHFLKCTGVSFSQFVNQVRISHASRLLHTTADSVSAIAFQTGFSNLSNFNRIFRKLKGVSPSQYRKRIHRNAFPVEQ